MEGVRVQKAMQRDINAMGYSYYVWVPNSAHLTAYGHKKGHWHRPQVGMGEYNWYPTKKQAQAAALRHMKEKMRRVSGPAGYGYSKADNRPENWD